MPVIGLREKSGLFTSNLDLNESAILYFVSIQSAFSVGILDSHSLVCPTSSGWESELVVAALPGQNGLQSRDQAANNSSGIIIASSTRVAEGYTAYNRKKHAYRSHNWSRAAWPLARPGSSACGFFCTFRGRDAGQSSSCSGIHSSAAQP